MKLKYNEALALCPAAVVNLALAGHLELRRGYPYVIEFLGGRERCLWAECDGEPVGLFLWTVLDDGLCWWVDFAYVAPDSRKAGVYLALRKKVVGMARRDPLCQSIQSHVKFDNRRMRELNEKAGSVAVSVKYRTDVKKP